MQVIPKISTKELKCVHKTFRKLDFLTPIYIRTCAYQGVRIASFSEILSTHQANNSLCKKFGKILNNSHKNKTKKQVFFPLFKNIDLVQSKKPLT